MATTVEINGGKIETGTQGTGPATIKYVSNQNFSLNFFETFIVLTMFLTY